MTTHPLRKIFIHLFVYILIILGIFAIQFRNQSIISKNFGQLRLSISKPPNSVEEKDFAGNFSINYKGLTLFSSQEMPVLISNSEKTQGIKLLHWESLSESSFELFFTQDISLLCGLTGQNKDILTITYNSKDTEDYSLSIPYEISPSYAIMQSNNKRLIFSGKMLQTVLNAASIENTYLHLTMAENNLSYTNYEPTKEFMFEESITYALADKAMYENTLFELRKKMLTNFNAIDSISETQVVSFIAEHLEQGSYREGIKKIPQSFLTSSKRSFISSPYFNNLSSMQRSLMMFHENMSYKIQHALETKKVDAFQAESFSEFLLTQDKSIINSFLQILSSLEDYEPSVLEATGIIESFLLFQKYNRVESSQIEPFLFLCIKTIQNACELEDEKLYLVEKEVKFDMQTSLRIAKAIIDYAVFIQSKEIETTGYFIANSALQNFAYLSAQEIANLYPILIKTAYYPHFELLSQESSKPIWAWTSAKSLTLTTNSDDTITIRIEFPVDQSHYIIIHNIEAFQAIEIYEMFFRTDPRFESYDSSGYVYDAGNKNLLLKVKHKTPVEIIKLFYRTPVDESAEENKEDNGEELEKEVLTDERV